MTSRVEHLLIMCLLATWLFFSVKYLFTSLAPFKLSYLFPCCWVLRALPIFWTQILYQIGAFAKIFSQSMAWVFLLLKVSFKVLKLLAVMKFSWSFNGLCFLASYRRNLRLTHSHRHYFPVFSSRIFIGLCLCLGLLPVLDWYLIMMWSAGPRFYFWPVGIQLL